MLIRAAVALFATLDVFAVDAPHDFDIVKMLQPTSAHKTNLLAAITVFFNSTFIRFGYVFSVSLRRNQFKPNFVGSVVFLLVFSPILVWQSWSPRLPLINSY